MFMKQIDSRLIEAALFSAGRPLSIRELQELTGMDKNEVTSSLRSLVQSYRKRETSLEISRVGRKYTMKLREEYVINTVADIGKLISENFDKTKNNILSVHAIINIFEVTFFPDN